MSGDLVTKYKWHLVWEDEQQEEWLRARAREGLHFVRTRFGIRYQFRRGLPDDVVYRMDYAPPRYRDEQYVQLFEDAGWEHVFRCQGWEYWRKPMSARGSHEIFSDRVSKAAQLQRVRNKIGGFGIISLAAVWGNPNYWHFDRAMSVASRAGLAAIAVALLAGYVYGLCKLTQRIRSLQA
jgi:hypothetical protein